MIEPRAVRSLREHSTVRARLEALGYEPLDLVVGVMTIIYRRQ